MMHNFQKRLSQTTTGMGADGNYRHLLRRLSNVLLCGLMMLLLTGCHGSKGKDAFVMPESFDTSKNYNITFWAKNDTNKTQVAVYEKAVSDFEALYPNVKVNLRLYTDYGQIYNDVITNISTDTTPNVCIAYPDNMATYLIGGNTLVPLDQLFEDSKYGFGGSEIRYDGPRAEEVIPKFLRECTIDGRIYGLPYMRSTEICYVNKSLVEKLGYELPETLTWDFIWEVSEKAMEKDGDGVYKVNGQKVLIPFIYKSTDNMMFQLLEQQGATYCQAEDMMSLFSDEASQILKEVSVHTKSGAFSTFKISGYPGNFLNAGQCIFAVDSSAGATWMGADAPLSDIAEENKVDFEMEIMMVPQLDPSNPKMISQGPSLCIFNKENPQEVLASWLFTQFLLTNEVQLGYAETEGYVPVTSKAQNSPEYQDYLSRSGQDAKQYYWGKIDATKILLEHVDDTFVTPVFNGSISIRNAAGQLIEDVTKSVRRKKTVDDEYISQLYKDVASLYRLDQLMASGNNNGDQLGALPRESVFLLVMLAVAWVLIAAVFLLKKGKNKKS